MYDGERRTVFKVSTIAAKLKIMQKENLLGGAVSFTGSPSLESLSPGFGKRIKPTSSTRTPGIAVTTNAYFQPMS